MLSFILYSIMFFVTFGSGVTVGSALVTVNERKKWSKLKRIAIAGQRIYIRGLGTVCVLGYSEDESTVDLIHEKFLGEKMPSEIDEDILNQHTFSVPTTQFITQIADTAFLKAAQVYDGPVSDNE